MSQPQHSITTDRHHLTTHAYATSTHLAARQTIYHYQHPPITLLEWALDHITWNGQEHVIDIGCGNGTYLRRIATRLGPYGRLRGLDLSHGMLTEIARNWNLEPPLPTLITADIQALPIPSASYDIALAMHMLYHVPDIETAVQELRRIVRPHGILLVSTNGLTDKNELQTLYTTAYTTLTGQPTPNESWPDRFSLEHGAEALRHAFKSVESHALSSELRIPEPEPILRYIESTRPIRSPSLPPDLRWETIMAEIKRNIIAHIIAEGTFRVHTHVGIFICRS